MVWKKLRPVWLAKLMLFYPQLFKISFFWDLFWWENLFSDKSKVFQGFLKLLINLSERAETNWAEIGDLKDLGSRRYHLLKPIA